MSLIVARSAISRRPRLPFCRHCLAIDSRRGPRGDPPSDSQAADSRHSNNRIARPVPHGPADARFIYLAATASIDHHRGNCQRPQQHGDSRSPRPCCHAHSAIAHRSVCCAHRHPLTEQQRQHHCHSLIRDFQQNRSTAMRQPDAANDSTAAAVTAFARIRHSCYTQPRHY